VERPWATFKDGALRIDRLAGPVPPFLLQANQAVLQDDLGRARGLLCPAALLALESALAEGPVRIDLMYMAATLLLTLGQPEQAAAWCQRILAEQPEPAAHHHLARCLSEHLGRQTEALDHARMAFEAEPDNPWFCDVYGRLLFSAGLHRRGIEVLERAVAADPGNATWLSETLWHRHYVTGFGRRDFFEGYRRWGGLVTAGIQARDRFDNDPDPDRRIRVGLLSPDLHKGSAATSLEPFLDAHDHQSLEVFGYGDLAAADEVTERMASRLHRLRDVRGVSARQIATVVEQDGIDVLVAYAGHVQGNYLEVLAYRPAPIQMDGVGIDTTGLERVDYRITDALVDPPESQPYHAERLAYLAGGLGCFRPPRLSPLVGPLPAKVNGCVTFGSFNVNIKITDEMMALWARILRETPGSRLTLKFMAGHDPQIRAAYLDRFGRLGVDPHRITLHGRLSPWDHLELLGQVDMALDTHPYSGCITTMEGLWMGVPTLTLGGETFVSRMALSVLHRVGLDAFASSSPEEYVAKACAYSRQWDALEQIRSSLRPRMLASPLCDPARLAREMEQIFRSAWRQWCSQQRSPA
jgi:protein O-GlcNAc transferase